MDMSDDRFFFFYNPLQFSENPGIIKYLGESGDRSPHASGVKFFSNRIMCRLAGKGNHVFAIVHHQPVQS